MWLSTMSKRVTGSLNNKYAPHSVCCHWHVTIKQDVIFVVDNQTFLVKNRRSYTKICIADFSVSVKSKRHAGFLSSHGGTSDGTIGCTCRVGTLYRLKRSNAQTPADWVDVQRWKCACSCLFSANAIQFTWVCKTRLYERKLSSNLWCQLCIPMNA